MQSRKTVELKTKKTISLKLCYAIVLCLKIGKRTGVTIAQIIHVKTSRRRSDLLVSKSLECSTHCLLRFPACYLDSDLSLYCPTCAQAGDKAGANAALKELVASSKLTKYVSSGVVSGSKFVDAVGLVSGETPP